MNENTGKLYGYIRVSTKEQNEDRQRVAMHEFGITEYISNAQAAVRLI